MQTLSETEVIMKLIRNAILSLSVLVIIFFAASFIYISSYKAEYNINGHSKFALVFGAGITIESKPSPALKLRLDKAIKLYKKDKIEYILISGKLKEVYVMNQYLFDNGVENKKIIEDTNGNNTYSSVINTKDYMRNNGITDSVVFISQKFHMPRIILLARKENMSNIIFVSADKKEIADIEYLYFISRESVALIKSLFYH